MYAYVVGCSVALLRQSFIPAATGGEFLCFLFDQLFAPKFEVLPNCLRSSSAHVGNVHLPLSVAVGTGTDRQLAASKRSKELTGGGISLL